MRKFAAIFENNMADLGRNGRVSHPFPKEVA